MSWFACQICGLETGENLWWAEFLSGERGFLCEQCYRQYWRELVRGTVSRYKRDRSTGNLVKIPKFRSADQERRPTIGAGTSETDRGA
jgi:hypothetical protein